MSYIKITIGPLSQTDKGVDIPGSNERGLKFNNYGLEIMAGKMGGSALSFAYAMIYGGLMGNSYAKEIEPEYSFENVIDWIDEIPQAERVVMIENVTKVMTETQNYKDLIKAGTEVKDTAKKKAIKKSVLKT